MYQGLASLILLSVTQCTFNCCLRWSSVLVGQLFQIFSFLGTFWDSIFWPLWWRKVKSESCSIVFNSLRPHGLYSPWNSPGQNAGVGTFPFSRGSSQPRDQTHVSLIAGGFFSDWAPGKPKWVTGLKNLSICVEKKMTTKGFNNISLLGDLSLVLQPEFPELQLKENSRSIDTVQRIGVNW